MDNILKELTEQYNHILLNESSCIIASLDKNGYILSANTALRNLLECDLNGKNFIDFLVQNSKSVFMRMLSKTANNNLENSANLHIIKSAYSMPISVKSWIFKTKSNNYILYAEPLPAVGEEQAKEYAIINSELAIVTRQLQKTNYELAERTAALEKVNRQLEEEIAERKKVEKELAQKRLLELQIAAEIQKNLLIGKKPNNFPGIDIEAVTIASQTVDGDFYDFFVFDDDVLDIVIGDVMGKGVPACLIGAANRFEVQKAIANLFFKAKECYPPSPVDIVQVMHTEFTPKLIELDSFVTLNYSRFDMQKKQLIYVDCGHSKTIHFKANEQKCEMLAGRNVPLGIRKSEKYKEYTIPFLKDDLFFFYSDGLIDAENNEHEIFGEDRIMDTICNLSHLSAKKIVAEVMQIISNFTLQEGSRDDLTIIAAKIL
ncbi:MAG: SpoIIE family protein phosphatase [Armatimonadota bacterium]